MVSGHSQNIETFLVSSTSSKAHDATVLKLKYQECIAFYWILCMYKICILHTYTLGTQAMHMIPVSTSNIEFKRLN